MTMQNQQKFNAMKNMINRNTGIPLLKAKKIFFKFEVFLI